MTLAERIEAFEFIKNIPYRVGLHANEPTYTCETKSRMLERILAGLGLKSRQMLCNFSWQETSLPPEVLSCPHQDICLHQYMQVLIPESGAWVNVDPTWDYGLAALGLPIATWDGLHETALAVQPHKIFSEEEAQKLFASFADLEQADAYMKKHEVFFHAMNECFEQARYGIRHT